MHWCAGSRKQLLLDFKGSFDNFDAVARRHNFTGWSADTASPVCEWTGIGCSSSQVSISLRYLNLTGAEVAVAVRCSGPVSVLRQLHSARLRSRLRAA